MSEALDKALPHVVTGLIAKQREIAGQVEDLRQRLKQAVTDLDHIEASIRLFCPDIDFSEIPPRAVAKPYAAAKGEVSRILLEALRKAPRPLSTTDLAHVVMDWRQMPKDNAKLVKLTQQRTGACLSHWRRRGVLKSSMSAEHMQLWEIASDTSGAP